MVIWGAGAIGGTLGAYLLRHGQDVCFVDRDAAHVEAIRSRGLTIRGFAETFTVGPAPALLPEEVRGPLHEVILCVKGPQTAAAVEQIRPHLAADGYVVSLQNGLNEPLIAAAVGAERTVGAFVNFSADYLEPGVIAYGGPGTLAVGEIDGRITPRVHDLARRFGALLPCTVTDNIFGYLWSKLGYGAMLFGTALVDAPMADCLERYPDVLVALGREPLTVAEALGVRPLPFDRWEPDVIHHGSPEAVAAALAALRARMRADQKQKSGIWRDLAVRRRKTEVDCQLGVVVAEGRRLGVPTPLAMACARMIHELEDGVRRMDWANLEELRAAAAAG
jgi:2-dehydropantoate 2-reductase